MKVFSVVGYSASGKTTTIEHIVKELKARGYSVGTVKEIASKGFTMDLDGSNTSRHRAAGAELVAARSENETDFIYSKRLNIDQILVYFNTDFVVMEGIEDANVPRIITAKDEADIAAKQDGTEILLSGVIADSRSTVAGIKAVSAMKDVKVLVDLIEENVPDLLPDFSKKCCGLCGMSCREMLKAMIKGEKSRGDCLLEQNEVNLRIDGQVVEMVPFVQSVLKNNVLALVKELNGYEPNRRIDITISAEKRSD